MTGVSYLSKAHDKLWFMEGMTLNKSNYFGVIWMFVGMMLGMAIGCVIGISQGSIGTSMCFGLVFGIIIGIGIVTTIKKFKDKK